MDHKQYEVEITFQQTVRIAVDADDPDGAERAAMDRWQGGDPDAVVGSDCCDVVGLRATELPDEDSAFRDAEKVFRYLRDRELVIEMLDGDAFNPTIHDAVSAEEVAIHFNWIRKGGDLEGLPAIPRAARALDRLCERKRVVCLERERVRAGERGQIRLYCTPQHLELLTALVIPDAVLEPTHAEEAAEPAGQTAGATA
jgi:hypothetical protein